MQKQLLGALALFVLAFVFVGEASALVQRTFVSGLGSDANPCSRTEPCRTFAAAIAQTQAGGEVLALDTAGYGPVTVTKAISLISPPGVYAGITTTTGGTTAIVVAAGANDVVILKGLSLTGLGLGSNGIFVSSARALYVEGLTISGFTFQGINFQPSAQGELSVLDSVIRNNGESAISTYAPEGNLARVTIDRTRLVGNAYGLLAGTRTRAIVRDSVAANNTAVGFWASQPTSVLNLENCLAVGNNEGVNSWGLTRVAGSTVTENTFGVLSAFGGSVFSRANNTVEGNLFDGVFTGTFTAK